MFFSLISGKDIISLESRPLYVVYYTHIQPTTADVFLVVANTHTKSIQKQIVEHNIKSKCPEEHSTVNKVGSEKP